MNIVDADDELEYLLQQASTSTELPEICTKIKECIKRGANLGIHPSVLYIPLWSAISYFCPLEIIELLYNECKESVNIITETQYYNHSETRRLHNEKYDIKFYLATVFGEHFINMSDDDIDKIEYALKCIEILNIKESDIIWDIELKYGAYD